MNLLINGENTRIDSPCTVLELLRSLGIGSTPCAVEVNGDVVTRRDHAERELTDGDRVELVTLVGGG